MTAEEEAHVRAFEQECKDRLKEVLGNRGVKQHHLPRIKEILTEVSEKYYDYIPSDIHVEEPADRSVDVDLRRGVSATFTGAGYYRMRDLS